MLRWDCGHSIKTWSQWSTTWRVLTGWWIVICIAVFYMNIKENLSCEMQHISWCLVCLFCLVLENFSELTAFSFAFSLCLCGKLEVPIFPVCAVNTLCQGQLRGNGPEGVLLFWFKKYIYLLNGFLRWLCIFQ